MDNFLKIKVFLYYQFLIIENYLYLWKNGTSKTDKRLYYNEYHNGSLYSDDFKYSDDFNYLMDSTIR